jgi:DNA-binding IclR family transcriptional regulator
LNEKQSKKNQSVEKVFQIIEIMAENKGSMRLLDVSQKLQLPASTVLRFLNTLLTFGYVYQDEETLKYSLTMKFCHIGELVRSKISILDIAKPFLVTLSEKCHESTCLAIENDMTVLYIDAVDGPDKMLKTLQRIGKCAPMHSTGVGKLMLLGYDDTKINKYITDKGLSSLTQNTITTKELLLKELASIRTLGYALDNEECEIGARCLAAPIKDYTGNTTACISVSGPVSRMSMDKINSIKDYVKEAAEIISIRMGRI